MTINRLPTYFQLERYGIDPDRIARLSFRCAPDAIQTRAIIMPNWRADIFARLAGEITEVSAGLVYQLTYQGRSISLIRSGIGAPRTGDTILALGCTRCERIIFAGSAGGLLPAMRIGDLLIPARSVCGDGFSRYLNAEVCGEDCFLQPVEPDPDLARAIKDIASQLAGQEAVLVHCGAVFSIDSIIAQFSRIDYLVKDLGCIGIEMETAAAFRAARLLGIQMAALLQLSDVIPAKQTVFADRPAEDMERRKLVRETILARAVLDALVEC